MKHPLTVHHILPQSFGGNLHPNNTVMLRQTYHRALHTLFADDTPIQRLRRALEVDKEVMRPDIYLAISNTLKRFEGVIEIESYEPDCFNSDKFFSKCK